MSSGAVFNIWGVVTGALGTLGLLPIVFAVISSQLPSRQLKILDHTLEETESLLRSVAEEGLFSESNFIDYTRHRLSGIHFRAEQYRMATYCATTLGRQLKEMLKGLSRRIYVLCQEIREVRAEISVTTSEERKRLQTGASLGSSLRQPISASQPVQAEQRAVLDFGHASEAPRPVASSGVRHASTSTCVTLVDALCSDYLAPLAAVPPVPLVFSATARGQPARCHPARSDSDNSSAPEVIGTTHPQAQLRVSRKLHRALQTLNRELAAQGRRHSLLARIVRLGATTSSRIPRSCRRKSTMLSQRSSTVLLYDDDLKEHDEDDAWEDEDQAQAIETTRMSCANSSSQHAQVAATS